MVDFAPTYLKQVLVVRSDLKMPVGKIAAQCAHGSMSIFFSRCTFKDKKIEGELSDDMMAWCLGEFTKVVLKVNSEQELLDIYEQAKSLNLPCSIIEDNGRTCFNEVRTFTVVAIGPAKSEVIDLVTGKLKLL